MVDQDTKKRTGSTKNCTVYTKGHIVSTKRERSLKNGYALALLLILPQMYDLESI
jgi:hypothetical protein